MAEVAKPRPANLKRSPDRDPDSPHESHMLNGSVGNGTEEEVTIARGMKGTEARCNTACVLSQQYRC